jgi:S1-C subfamily serine protease
MTQIANPLELLQSISNATTTLIQKIAKSVVSVNNHMSQGTGIVLDKQGHIATCAHVLHGCNTIKVGQGEKTYNAKIVGTDAYNDIALLKIDKPEDLAPIELGDSSKLHTGQFVLALANPFNRKQPTATTGIITNTDATLRFWRSTAMENVIATDAKLNPGFSGGPLIDATGKMIGMNSAYVWSRGIAIPSNKIKTITNRLLNGGQLKRAYLGIVSNTVRIPEELAEQAGINQQTGVMIFSVERDSPARKAGLTMGDVIIKFNSQPVTNFYDLPALLTEDVINKNIEIIILREEKLTTLTIKPKAAEEENDD